ncbi:MAG: hypothetical protein Q4C89_06490 [Deinococcus sp.]|uniref:hypothetical protein n=1 Tax=Deinococcus sp. TaxID=47478 RepID=UPI0026DC97C9|nr:hypothetical protein [Deinococcus sp.]MDO4245652.1 hypothetical protein [Deinococcus sp.]
MTTEQEKQSKGPANIVIRLANQEDYAEKDSYEGGKWCVVTSDNLQEEGKLKHSAASREEALAWALKKRRLGVDKSGWGVERG